MTGEGDVLRSEGYRRPRGVGRRELISAGSGGRGNQFTERRARHRRCRDRLRGPPDQAISYTPEQIAETGRVSKTSARAQRLGVRTALCVCLVADVGLTDRCDRGGKEGGTP